MKPLRIEVNGREYELTQEQARRMAVRMAEREAESPEWGETAMLLLDYANREDGR